MGLASVNHSITTQWVSPVQAVAGPAVNFGSPPASGDDDEFFDLQWGHDAIDAPEAWNAGARGDGARVAVIDTGFDTDHPDLAPNVNFGLSANFVPGETLTYAINDPFSHGSHTAGTVAAADNGFGTIGVAPEAELVLVKGLPDEGCGSDAPILQGIVHAAGIADADIISMSLGSRLEKSGYLEVGCDPGPADDVFVTASEVSEIRKAWARVVGFATAQGATGSPRPGTTARTRITRTTQSTCPPTRQVSSPSQPRRRRAGGSTRPLTSTFQDRSFRAASTPTSGSRRSISPLRAAARFSRSRGSARSGS